MCIRLAAMPLSSQAKIDNIWSNRYLTRLGHRTIHEFIHKESERPRIRPCAVFSG